MPDIPDKRKRKVNPKLLDNDNMSIDAIKRRKVEATKTVKQPQTKQKPSTSRRVSVEVVEDDDIGCHNAGTPTNPNTILESANDDDDDGIYVTASAGQAAERAKTKEAETEEELEETDEDELGMAIFDRRRKLTLTTSSALAKGLAVEGICLLSVQGQYSSC